jgi:hypothetical protein
MGVPVNDGEIIIDVAIFGLIIFIYLIYYSITIRIEGVNKKLKMKKNIKNK